MSTLRKSQMDIRVTTTIMQKNWSSLKTIRVKDILDPMIEQSLISIEDSTAIQKKEMEYQKAEALLYIVFSKPQNYLDSFIAILAKNGYEHIVEKLRKDQAANASKDHEPKTSGKFNNAVESDDNKVLSSQFSEMKAELQQMQEEATQKQVEMMKQQQSELKKDLINAVKAEFAELKQSEEQRKRNEDQIRELEAQLKAVQKKLDEELAKKKDVSISKRVKELEKERDELKQTLEKVKRENRYLRNLVQAGRGGGKK